MTEYMIEKEKARNMAVEWQNDFYNHNYSYDELWYTGRSILNVQARFMTLQKSLRKMALFEYKLFFTIKNYLTN